MTTHRISLSVNVFDPEALHDQAVKAYIGTDDSAEKRESALDWLGTTESPDITNCLLEIWAENTPVDSGYEFTGWDNAVAIA